MNEIDFRSWLSKNNISKKMQTDYISRLKKIERDLSCDLDDCFNKDRCSSILIVFSNKGVNDAMASYQNASFPTGKNHIATYTHSIKKYVNFCDSLNR